MDNRTVSLAVNGTSTPVSLDFSGLSGTRSFQSGSGENLKTYSFDAGAQETYLFLTKTGGTNSLNGATVTYDGNDWTDIVALADVGTCTASVVSSRTLSLQRADGSTVRLDFSSATGTSHSLGTSAFDPSAQSTYLVFGAIHGLTEGLEVTYNTAVGGAVGGLTDEATYHVHVVDDHTITLSAASGGPAIALNWASASQSGHLLEYDNGGTPDSVAFDPTVQDTYVVCTIGHGLANGQSVSYDPGSAAAIGGLTDGGTYHVIRNGDGTISLRSSSGGSALTLAFSQTVTDTHALTSATAIAGDGEFISGQKVVFHSQSATGVEDSPGATFFGGLVAGATYTVQVQGDGGYVLYDSGNHMVALNIDAFQSGDGTSYYLSSAFALTIDAGTTLIAGETVRFESGSGNAIDGLVDGHEYTVGTISGQVVTLLDGSGNPVGADMFSAIAARTHTDSLDKVYHLVSLDKLDLGVEHGFSDGAAVVYHQLGSTGIGLVEGASYTVEKVDATTIMLRDAGGNLVDLDVDDFDGSEHRFVSARALSVDPAVIVFSLTTLNLGTAHELNSGDLVTYHAGGDGDFITGLTDGADYYVDVVNETTIRLAASLEDLMTGAFIALDTTTVSAATSGHRFTVVDTGSLNTAADVVDGFTIELGYAHGLTTGDSVVYNSGNGDAIGGLVDGQIYSVVVVTPTSFQLTASLDGILVDSPLVLSLGDTESGSHEFTVTEVADSGMGDVTLTANGAILAAGGGSLISGGSVFLTAGTTIGSAAQALRLDMATSSSSSLTGVANGDIHIQEVSGNLNLVRLESRTGDVALIADGTIRDANRTDEEDSRTADELLDLWDDMNLTGTAAEAAAQESIDAYLAMRDREYATYWEYRDRQDDPSVYDPQFNFTFTDRERTLYEDYFTELGASQGKTGEELAGFVDDTLTTLENKRTDEYRELHSRYGVLGDTRIDGWSYATSVAYEPSFDAASDVEADADAIVIGTHLFSTGQAVLYRADGGTAIAGLEDNTVYFVIVVDATTIQLAASEADALAPAPVALDLTAGGSGVQNVSDTEAMRQGSVWTDSELKYALGGGWLKETSDTTVRVEDPNVVGANITLEAAGLGSQTDQLVIDLSNGLTDLSDEQKLILVSAERRDMVIVNPDENSITFGTVHELTTGQTVNLAERWQMYGIAGLTDGATYHAVVVDDFTFQLAASYDAAASGDVLDITAREVRIFSHEDLDVAASGTLSATVTGDAYLGSEQSLALGRIVAGGLVQIKVDGSITDGSVGDAVGNVEAGDLLLEAGRGALGTEGDEADVDITLTGGVLTARAEGSIFLTSVAGDMRVDTIYAEQDVTLRTEGGSIVDAYDTDNQNIAAVNLTLVSQSGIGTAANALETNLTPEGALTADAAGDISLTERAGDMNIGRVSSATGDVYLVAAVSMLGRENDINADIAGNSITLTALAGSLGAPNGEDINIDSARSNVGVLTSSSHANSYIHETAGDLTLFAIGSTLGTAFIDSSGASTTAMSEAATSRPEKPGCMHPQISAPRAINWKPWSAIWKDGPRPAAYTFTTRDI